jgi:hypothetical protein
MARKMQIQIADTGAETLKRLLMRVVYSLIALQILKLTALWTLRMKKSQ